MFSGPTNYIALSTAAFFGIGMYIVGAGLPYLPFAALVAVAAVDPDGMAKSRDVLPLANTIVVSGPDAVAKLMVAVPVRSSACPKVEIGRLIKLDRTDT